VKEIFYLEKNFGKAVNIKSRKIMSSHVCRPEEKRGFDIG